MKRYIIFIICLFLTVSSVQAKTWHVPDSVATIQAAINAAVDSDTVLVSEGIYYENISFGGKQITIASQFLVDQDTSHIANTIIDGSRPSLRKYASVVYFTNGENSNSKLIGFTITGGEGTTVDPLEMGITKAGGGIFIFESGATIENNIITGNIVDEVAYGAGGGVFFYSNSTDKVLIFQMNSVTNNEVTTDSLAAGGGLALYGRAIMNYNKIFDNSLNSGAESVGGGLINWNLSDDFNYEFQMKHNLIADNQSYATDIVWGVGCAVLLLGESSLLYNNTIVRNNSWESNSLGGGLTVLYSFPFLLSSNIIKDNRADVGGGIALWYTSPLVRNNLIIDNEATFGAGIFINKSPWNYLFIDKSTELVTKLRKFNKKYESYRKLEKHAAPTQASTDAFFVNNTIIKNEASIQAASILSTYGVSRIENSIIVGNVSPDSTQNSGEFIVRYSNIEGGCAGEEIIDADPLFADTIHYYLTPDVSPCIDAGNPVPVFNDIEDNAAAGMARFPSLGTVRNDMGAYGGDPLSRDIDHTFLGLSFRAFAERVMNEQPYLRSGIVDSFMAAVPDFPFIDGKNIVYYLYRGGANQVHVPGDMNSWQQNAFPMTRLAGTDLFYRQDVYESDARLDYKFVINGSSWILDPLNDNKMMSGYGPNSELAMPDYVRGPEISYYPNIPHGTLVEKFIYSTHLRNNRKVRIYLPAEYDENPEKSYPVLLAHDGSEYLSIANANNILDYLIAHDRIVPIIGVFVPPVNRNEEYAFSQKDDYMQYILEEVMTMIDTTYRTERDPSLRAMTGISFGGLISTYICYHHPEQFGLCAPCSPAYWPEDRQIYYMLLYGPRKDLKMYIDWGSYESELMVDGRTLAEYLPLKGYQVKWNEWHEGHSWGNWREHLDIVLEYFFASPTNVQAADPMPAIPEEFSISQNYPNPFNPVAKIDYALPADHHVNIRIFDVTGRLVSVLLDKYQGAGQYSITWNAAAYPSGVYFCRFQAGPYKKTIKMSLVK
ncbi:T9SS type A sorting domain-containing protein [candidate division KSB1 bacterium]|nr:T9SS type A sorting domain-containing protein [candidate division KSB1 bacterium]